MNFMSRLTVKFKNLALQIQVIIYRTDGEIKMDLQIIHIFIHI
jgi:hypothetical protein